MDELDRTLSELRRTVVEGGKRALARGLPAVSAPPEPPVHAETSPSGSPMTGPAVVDGRDQERDLPTGARPGRVQGQLRRELAGVWPRLRLPVLLVLTTILAALLLV